MSRLARSAFRRPLFFRRFSLERLEDRQTPAIFLVTNLDDAGPGSLRQAVTDANNNIDPNPDTILFQASVGTITLTTAQIDISDPLNITGPGATSLTISGGNKFRIFEVNNNAPGAIHVGISGLTLANGNDGGSGGGGAIRVADEDLALADVVLTGNVAGTGGAARLNANSRLTMDRCTVSGNSATGGGLYLDDDSVTIIRDSVISGNKSSGNGGGLYLDFDTTLLMQRTSVINNTTVVGGTATGTSGGGIFFFDRGSCVIENSTIAGNATDSRGGGIDGDEVAFTLVNSTVSGNVASNNEGGGIHLAGNYGGGQRPAKPVPFGKGGGPNLPADIRNSTLTGNFAGTYGGGIYAYRDVTVSNSIISGNTADDGDIANGYYTGNPALGEGGGNPVGGFTVSFSLIQNKGTANVNDVVGNIFNQTANLLPLQDNGGPTLTHAPSANSPALNTADPAFSGLSFDQRGTGFPRVAGGRLDMGAVETQNGFVIGTVFDDANGDGAFGMGEAGLFDRFVWLDTNNNRSPDNDEVTGTTDATGQYVLQAPPGTYQTLVANVAGRERTTADPAPVAVTAGGTVNGGDFGLRLLTGLHAFQGSGSDAAGIKSIVDAFRADLGALNANIPGTFDGGAGRREINWDGVPDAFSSPNGFPGTFFNLTSPRGVEVTTQGTGFQVSGKSGVVADPQLRFGNLNAAYPGIFQTFSAQRLFTPINSNTHDVNFFVPGSNEPATVSGFGAVFVEADNPVESSLEFFDAFGNSIGFFLVPHQSLSMGPGEAAIGGTADNGLAFVGIKFTDGRRAAKVRITTGHAVVGANEDHFSHDVVVLDDFIYGEPVAINVTPPPPPEQNAGLFAVGSGVGGNAAVKVYTAAGKFLMDFRPFDGSFTGEVHVATGDVTGDGVDDVITGAGPFGGPHVQVFDGARILNQGVAERIVSSLGSYFAYNPAFLGGVFVAAGDVNGDGRADIITGAGPGGGPHVIAWNVATGQAITSFFAYDPVFTGGVSVAAGDLDGNFRAEIITGAGPGGGPHVRAFNAAGALVKEFFAYDASFLGGVFVAAGDVNGDNRADIITGAGAGGGPHVMVYDGNTLAAIRSFYAFDGNFSGGVRVATTNFDNDSNVELIVGAGFGGGPHVRVVDDKDNEQLDSFYAFDPNFNGGVYVG